MEGLIDTHCHLYLEEFDEDRGALASAARASGIAALLSPNVDLETADRLFRFCEEYPDWAFPMMGLHPTSVTADYAHVLNQIEKLLSVRSYCGIGEIGIDLYWDQTYKRAQIEVFEEQLRWSAALGLPVAIHMRNAFPEVMASIYKVGPEKLSGVFHCFGGTSEELAEITRLPRFKIGINGIVTFKKSTLPDVLRGASLHQIVLETDAPYLAPVPFRGKRNEPTYIWRTAEKVAEIFQVPVEEAVSQSRKNTLEVFNSIKVD